MYVKLSDIRYQYQIIDFDFDYVAKQNFFCKTIEISIWDKLYKRRLSLIKKLKLSQFYCLIS